MKRIMQLLKGTAAIAVAALLFVGVQSAHAQTNKSESLTLTGKVLDSENLPLQGAAVLVKGTANGTVTGADGSFSIKVEKDKNAVLQFSFIGMKTVEIPLASAKDGMKVVLKDEENRLDEVVMTGYSKIRKESFTGSSTTVTRDEIQVVSPQSALRSLASFDPSFKMMTDNLNGSNPNNMSNWYIRGASGISEIKELDLATSTDVSEFSLKNNPSAPVFILDGFEVDQQTIFDMDINRIETITILKDAAATAVYGSRAANGVIVIETSAPEAGKVRVSYNTTLSLTTPDLTSYTLMNAAQALEAEKAAGLFESTNDGNNAGGLVNYGSLENNVIRGIDTDWIAKPVRTAFNHKHFLSLSGGSGSLRWGADINYQKKNGVMKESGRDTYGASMLLDYKYKSLQIRNKMTVNVMNSQESPYGQFSDYARMKPYLSPYEEDGDLVKQFNIYRNLRSTVSNPVLVLNPLYEASLGSYDRSGYKEFIDNLSLNWNITPYLMAKGTFSVSYRVQDSKKFVDPGSASFFTTTSVDEKGSFKTGDLRSSRWTANGILAYNRNLGRNYLNATLGAEASDSRSNSEYATFYGFVPGAKPSATNALKIKNKPTASDSYSRRVGTYLQFNYSYSDIYLLDLSGRYEGSSAFGAKEKMGTFWSGGLGLNLHNYDFMRNARWLDKFKIRSTYGVTGKANFSPYQARTTYEILYDNAYIDQWGMVLKALGNENLRWEKVNKFNLGAEIALFRNMVNIQADWYNELTVDQVEAISIPASSGFKTYMGNVGRVRNSGVDLKLNIRAYSSEDWTLYLFANANHNVNKITKIGDALKAYNESIDDFFSKYSSSSTDENFTKPFTKYEVGNSLTAIYGMKSLGIDPATGNELYEKRDGTVTYTWSSAEQQCLGDSTPKLSGTVGFNLRWKQWTLYSTFYYRLGGQAYNNTLSSIENVNLEYYNGDVRALTERWMKPGDYATLKSIKDRKLLTRPTSRFVQDLNELTFNSVSLGYNFENELIRKAGFSSCRLQFNMEELFTISTVRQERGTSYPYARTFNLSLNLSF
ncbi:MAG: SusC/RagA family TonB-linked outer membrane protein [Bacteroidales bacterium]|nr:SusC/RagA family TonB-linked outer membrane protein [Bacteroidales bacterium]